MKRITVLVLLLIMITTASYAEDVEVKTQTTLEQAEQSNDIVEKQPQTEVEVNTDVEIKTEVKAKVEAETEIKLKAQQEATINYEQIQQFDNWFTSKFDEVMVSKNIMSTQHQFDEVLALTFQSVTQEFRSGKTRSWCSSIAACKEEFLKFYDMTFRYVSIDNSVHASDMRHMYRKYTESMLMVIKSIGGTMEDYLDWLSIKTAEDL